VARQRTPDARMPLREHLVEARNRILLSFAGIVVASIGGWLLYPWAFQILQRPLEAAVDTTQLALNFPSVAASLDMQIKVSLFGGVILASPWWLFQLWKFINPGLKKRERRWALAFVGAAAPLFFAGVGLAWAIMPIAVRVLIGFTPEGVLNIIDAAAYLGFVMRLMLAFGLAFLAPVVMVVLNLLGIVRGKQLLSVWRGAVLVIFVFAAAATPTSDVVSLMALALPICALYFAAVGIALINDRRVDKRKAENPL
jgi:sec-independent protein translocase protein TatC